MKAKDIAREVVDEIVSRHIFENSVRGLTHKLNFVGEVGRVRNMKKSKNFLYDTIIQSIPSYETLTELEISMLKKEIDNVGRVKKRG